ncbi:hypothetical protein [Gemmobacter denitrificans]|uniref:Uncharacterized protein n=1 Tax=Gemmobacter denitrificans TaxID=3123040 RepID=A0ABU8BSH0_9RHOB
MAQITRKLLIEIEAFLAASGMGESYFGKAAAGNSELVARLRDNRRVWPETEAKVRRFIKSRSAILNGGHKGGKTPQQPPAAKNVAQATDGPAQ